MNLFTKYVIVIALIVFIPYIVHEIWFHVVSEYLKIKILFLSISKWYHERRIVRLTKKHEKLKAKVRTETINNLIKKFKFSRESAASFIDYLLEQQTKGVDADIAMEEWVKENEKSFESSMIRYAIGRK